MKFQKLLVLRMSQRGMSQSSLMARSGVNKTSINNTYRGITGMSEKNILKISTALGLTESQTTELVIAGRAVKSLLPDDSTRFGAEPAVEPSSSSQNLTNPVGKTPIILESPSSDTSSEKKSTEEYQGMPLSRDLIEKLVDAAQRAKNPIAAYRKMMDAAVESDLEQESITHPAAHKAARARECARPLRDSQGSTARAPSGASIQQREREREEREREGTVS